MAARSQADALAQRLVATTLLSLLLGSSSGGAGDAAPTDPPATVITFPSPGATWEGVPFYNETAVREELASTSGAPHWRRYNDPESVWVRYKVHVDASDKYLGLFFQLNFQGCKPFPGTQNCGCSPHFAIYALDYVPCAEVPAGGCQALSSPLGQKRRSHIPWQVANDCNRVVEVPGMIQFPKAGDYWIYLSPSAPGIGFPFDATTLTVNLVPLPAAGPTQLTGAPAIIEGSDFADGNWFWFQYSLFSVPRVLGFFADVLDCPGFGGTQHLAGDKTCKSSVDLGLASPVQPDGSRAWQDWRQLALGQLPMFTSTQNFVGTSFYDSFGSLGVIDLLVHINVAGAGERAQLRVWNLPNTIEDDFPLGKDVAFPMTSFPTDAVQQHQINGGAMGDSYNGRHFRFQVPAGFEAIYVRAHMVNCTSTCSTCTGRCSPVRVTLGFDPQVPGATAHAEWGNIDDFLYEYGTVSRQDSEVVIKITMERNGDELRRMFAQGLDPIPMLLSLMPTRSNSIAPNWPESIVIRVDRLADETAQLPCMIDPSSICVNPTGPTPGPTPPPDTDPRQGLCPAYMPFCRMGSCLEPSGPSAGKGLVQHLPGIGCWGFDILVNTVTELQRENSCRNKVRELLCRAAQGWREAQEAVADCNWSKAPGGALLFTPCRADCEAFLAGSCSHTEALCRNFQPTGCVPVPVSGGSAAVGPPSQAFLFRWLRRFRMIINGLVGGPSTLLDHTREAFAGAGLPAAALLAVTDEASARLAAALERLVQKRSGVSVFDVTEVTVASGPTNATSTLNFAVYVRTEGDGNAVSGMLRTTDFASLSGQEYPDLVSVQSVEQLESEPLTFQSNAPGVESSAPGSSADPGDGDQESPASPLLRAAQASLLAAAAACSASVAAMLW